MSFILASPPILGILLSTSLSFVSKAVVVTKPLVSGILILTPLIFVLKTVLVTKVLVISFFTSPIFSVHFVYLFCIDLCELK